LHFDGRSAWSAKTVQNQRNLRIMAAPRTMTSVIDVVLSVVSIVLLVRARCPPSRGLFIVHQA
jgi:hypothetical protein